MTEAESKVITNHIHWLMADVDGSDWDFNNIIYEFDSDGKTVDVTWWDDEGEKPLRTETYRIDIKLLKENQQ